MHAEAMKLDVVHVIGAFVAGGAERFVSDLLCALSRTTNLSLGVIALSARCDPAGEDMLAGLSRRGVNVAVGPTDAVALGSLAWYVATLRRWTPRIVHLHTENTELAHYLAKKVYGAPHTVLRTLHTLSDPPTRLQRHAYRYNSAALSIACSKVVYERWAPRLAGQSIVIENGVQFDWPIQTPTLRHEMQCALGLNSNGTHFVHVGSQKGRSLATAAKAQDVLVQAWKHSGLGKQNAYLHLLGDGNLRADLKALVGDEKSIVFQGVRRDVPDWLLAADCFVLSSRYEGLPIAGIEAMGTGVSCLVSDIPPLKALDAPWVQRARVDDVAHWAAQLREAFSAPLVPDRDAVQLQRERFALYRTAQRYAACYAPYLPRNGHVPIQESVS